MYICILKKKNDNQYNHNNYKRNNNNSYYNNNMSRKRDFTHQKMKERYENIQKDDVDSFEEVDAL